MNRWTLIPSACLAALLISSAGAQTENFSLNIRQFPLDAKRGELVVLAPPDITLDNKPDRLSTAVRIRNVDNQLVLSGAFVNQKLTVNYMRDNTGLVHNVWVLNNQEINEKMPGQPEGFLSNIRSMFEMPVVKDDGNRPFNQLPKYKQ